LLPRTPWAYAAKILKDHLSIFINFEEEPELEECGGEASKRMEENLKPPG